MHETRNGVVPDQKHQKLRKNSCERGGIGPYSLLANSTTQLKIQDIMFWCYKHVKICKTYNKNIPPPRPQEAEDKQLKTKCELPIVFISRRHYSMFWYHWRVRNVWNKQWNIIRQDPTDTEEKQLKMRSDKRRYNVSLLVDKLENPLVDLHSCSWR